MVTGPEGQEHGGEGEVGHKAGGHRDVEDAPKRQNWAGALRNTKRNENVSNERDNGDRDMDRKRCLWYGSAT